MTDALQVDPTLPQSSFPYSRGSATPGTPTGAEQLITASGPLAGKQGVYYLKAKSGSAMTITISAPVSGSSANQGDDGDVLEFVNLDGLAHTIQCGAASPLVADINGANYKAVFASGGAVVRFRAYGGVWYTNGAESTLT